MSRHEPSEDCTATPFPWSCILGHAWRQVWIDPPPHGHHYRQAHRCTRCGIRARHLNTQ